jgi:putative transposase
MKNSNRTWGAPTIANYLKKLGILISASSVGNILQELRRKGKINEHEGWKKFLERQINSIYACDFFTIDTVLFQRFYVLFVIRHKTREIIQFAITQHPNTQFLKQQMIELENIVNQTIYLIHDRESVLFHFDFSQFNIISISTSVRAPNMNAIAERFVGTIRRECIDHFYFLVTDQQIKRILDEYIQYYNFIRPHQGIDCRTPIASPPKIVPKHFFISRRPILGGLHHEYFLKKTA